VSPADYLSLQREARSFSMLGAHNLWFPTLSNDGGSERLTAIQLTPEVFDLLGARALHGRLFRADETVAGGERVVVLSWGLWMRRFGGDPAIVGGRIRLSGSEHEVVGVLPESYHHPDSHFPLDEAELFTPFAQENWASNRSRFLRVFGQLAPGVSLTAARGEVARLAARYEELHPETNSGRGATVNGLHEQLHGGLKQAVWLAFGASFLLFTIVCANAANLMLVRLLTRRREFAIRTALGASLGRVVRQLGVEATILAFAGGALGLAVQGGGLRLLRSWLRRFVPPTANFEIDFRVALFLLGVTLLAALLLSLLALLEVRRTGTRAVLSSESAGSGGSWRVLRLRRVLVAGEVALTIALVVGTGLLARSFARLSRVDPGFDPSRVLTAEILANERYGRPDQVRALYDLLTDRIRSIPGVDQVGFVSDLSLVTSENRSRRYGSPDRPLPPALQRDVEYQIASPVYFDAMRIPLRSGRVFSDADHTGSAPVVVVNEAAAAHFWPGEPAVGKHLTWAGPADTVVATVIGVVGSILDDGLQGEANAFVYHAFAQQPNRRMHLVARVSTDPLAVAQSVRSAIREVDPAIAVTDLDALQNRIMTTIAGPGATARLAAFIAAIALVLSGLGIYGIAAYDVGSRTREFSVRIALGAERMDVMHLVVRQALLLTAAGVVIGLVIALALAQLLRTFLFGVTPGDLTSYMLAPIVLALVSLAAAIGPARRALSVQPAQALRLAD
jgi:predicted permease